MTRVRPPESGDLDGVLALIEQASPRSGRDREAEHAVAARRDRFARLISAPDRVVLVAVDDAGAVIGTVVASDDELTATSPLRVLVVANLLVSVQERRRGVGRGLLTALVRQAEERGIEQIVVAAASQDRDANRYLARLGFHPLVIRRIAATSALRRSLGMSELVDRAVLRRRGARLGRGMLPARVSRGA